MSRIVRFIGSFFDNQSTHYFFVYLRKTEISTVYEKQAMLTFAVTTLFCTRITIVYGSDTAQQSRVTTQPMMPGQEHVKPNVDLFELLKALESIHVGHSISDDNQHHRVYDLVDRNDYTTCWRMFRVLEEMWEAGLVPKDPVLTQLNPEGCFHMDEGNFQQSVGRMKDTIMWTDSWNSDPQKTVVLYREKNDKYIWSLGQQISGYYKFDKLKEWDQNELQAEFLNQALKQYAKDEMQIRKNIRGKESTARKEIENDAEREHHTAQGYKNRRLLQERKAFMQVIPNLESYNRDKIESDSEGGIKFIDDMLAEISKVSTRWQSKMQQTLKDDESQKSALQLRLSSQIDKLTADNEKQMNKLNSENVRLVALSNENHALRQQLKDQQAENEKLRIQQDEFDDERNEWENAKKQMERELRIAQKRITVLEKNQITHQTREDELVAEGDRLSTEIAAISERLDQSENRHVEELAELQQQLRRKENEKQVQMILVIVIGGGVLVMFAIIVSVRGWGGNKRVSEDMNRALDAVFPSAHANRLGVDEDSTVDDVFGIKELWAEGLDEVPGEPVNAGESMDEVDEDPEAHIADLCTILNI